jgi:hypothetical protein
MRGITDRFQTVMPDLIPAKDGIVDRDPVAHRQKNPGFRVKPGMTNRSEFFNSSIPKSPNS